MSVFGELQRRKVIRVAGVYLVASWLLLQIAATVAPILALPDALLPPHKLREYLGPAVVEAALPLEDGVWSAPIETPQGWQLVRVVERSAPAPPVFEDVAAQVESEFRRRDGDRALREYLEWLRSEADVVLAPDAPQ